MLRLSDIVSRKGVRYVLLDFWASWCAPCREELPELVSIYGQYHRSGFEIYGISFDGNQQSWKDAIREFRMSWPNALAEFSGNASTSPFWTAYGVSGIPSNFLIDASTGEVIAKICTARTLRQNSRLFSRLRPVSKLRPDNGKQ